MKIYKIRCKRNERNQKCAMEFYNCLRNRGLSHSEAQAMICVNEHKNGFTRKDTLNYILEEMRCI